VTIVMAKLDDLSTNGRPADSRDSGGNENDLAPRQVWASTLSPGDREFLRRILDLLATAEILEDTRRLIVKSGRRFIFLDTADVDWIEARGNYVRLHVGLESYVARAGIGRIAERLGGAEFVRIHRSTIVNLRKIKELEPCDNGEHIVVLKDGKKLTSSRGYSGRLQQVIRRGCAF
jgi:two-component system, LytTR family, response regulator